MFQTPAYVTRRSFLFAYDSHTTGDALSNEGNARPTQSTCSANSLTDGNADNDADANQHGNSDGNTDRDGH